MVNPRKVYPVDPGLIAVFDRSGRANLGHALETAVRIKLERRGLQVGYVRTEEGHEVNFLVRHPGSKAELIQVCAELDDPAKREREARALLAAAAEFPGASLHLITLTPENARGLPAKVAFHSAALWFLSADSAGAKS
jgi:predicted AAA+ superfamily ATPase